MEKAFRFWMPIRKAGLDAAGRRWIEGIASDEGRDLQGEIVVQKGLDLDYFAKRGFFNWDHQDVVVARGAGGEEKICIGKIGEPTDVRLTPQGLYVKGFLYHQTPLADAVWDLANSLEASGAKRRLGFSIQGKTIARDGAAIARAWIQDVAITPAPVNPRTYLDVAKSLGTTPAAFGKALATGYETGADAPVEEGEGGALRPESLERAQPACPTCGTHACTIPGHAVAEEKGIEETVPGHEFEKSIEETLTDGLEKGLLGAATRAVASVVGRLRRRRPEAPNDEPAPGSTPAPTPAAAPPRAARHLPLQAGPTGELDARTRPWKNRGGVLGYGPEHWVPDPSGEKRGGGPAHSYPKPGSTRRAGFHGPTAFFDSEPAEPIRRAFDREQAVTFVQLHRGYSRPTAEAAVDLLFEVAKPEWLAAGPA